MPNESNICIDCICLPVCLNKTTVGIVKDCKLIADIISHLSDTIKKPGDQTVIHFFHLRDIKIQVYPDSVYVFDQEAGVIISVIIDRNR